MWAYRLPRQVSEVRPVVLRPSVMATIDAIQRATPNAGVWWLGTVEVRTNALLIVDICVPDQRVGVSMSSVVAHSGFDPAVHGVWGRILPERGALQPSHEDDALFEELVEASESPECVRLFTGIDDMEAAVAVKAPDGVQYSYGVPIVLGYEELASTQHRAVMGAIQRCIKTKAGRSPVKTKTPDGNVHFTF